MVMIELLATLGKSTIDSEGESRVNLVIPLEYRNEAMELIKMNEKVLRVSVEVDKNQFNIINEL